MKKLFTKTDSRLHRNNYQLWRQLTLMVFAMMMFKPSFLWATDVHYNWNGGVIDVFTPQDNNWLSDYVVNSSGDDVRFLGDSYYEREIAISGSFNNDPAQWMFRLKDGRNEMYVNSTQTLSIMNLFQGDWVKIFYWSGSSKQPEMKSSNTSVAKGSKVASGDPNNGGQGLVTMNSTGSMDFSIPNGMFITKIEVFHANTNNRIAFSTDGQESEGYYLCRLSSRNFKEPTLSVYPSNANVTYTVETYDGFNSNTILQDEYHKVAMMNTDDNKKGDVLFKNLGWCKVTATANGQSASYWVECWDNEAHGELQADGITYKLVKVKDGDGNLLPDDQQGGVLKERVVTAVPGIEMKFGIPAHDKYDYSNSSNGMPNAEWAQAHDNSDNHFQPNTTVVYRQVVNGVEHMVSFTNDNAGWWDRYPHNNYTWPHQGTFYQFKASAKGKLKVGGYKSQASGSVYTVNLNNTNDRNTFIQQNDPVGFYVSGEIEMQPGDIYMLHGEADQYGTDGEKWAPFLLEWFSFESDVKLSAEWGVAANTGYDIGNRGSVTTRETVTGASGATCTVECKGNIQSASATIDDSGHIVFSNIQFKSTEKDKMGGAMKVDIAIGTSILTYYFTIPYGQHVWDFRRTVDHSPTAPGDYSYSEEDLITMMKNNTEDWTRVYKVHRRENGKWTELKDAIMAARSAVAGNNAFYMDNTNGLAFVTSQPASFGAGETSNNTPGYSTMSQDDQYYLNYTSTSGGDLVWMQGTSTIYFPGVKAGQYIKVYHYRHADGKGETFSAKNFVDLDGETYIPTERFILHGMWESRVAGPNANGRVSGHTGDYMLGAAIFRVPDNYSPTNDINGIPSLTLTDDGWAQIYKIEISDAYKPDLIMTTEVNGSEAPIVNDGLNSSVVVRVKNGVAQPVTVVHNAYVSNTGCQNANTCDYVVEADPGVNVTVSKEKLSGGWYNKLTITYNGGYGLVKIIQRERVINSNTISSHSYVIDKKEYFISVGQLTEQAYPYTWDFSTHNMYQRSSTTKSNLANSMTGNAGSWENVNSENGKYTQLIVGVQKMGKGVNTADPYQVLNINKPLFAQGGELIVGNQVMAEGKGLGLRLPYASEQVLFPRVSSEAYSSEEDKKLYAEVFTDRYYKVYDITKSVMVDGNCLTGAEEFTIPSVDNGMYIFVMANKAPYSIEGAEAATVKDGVADGKFHIANSVFLYKKTGAKGDVVLNFATDAKVEKIGVTNIEKSINKLGYATESRNHSIDHTYTGEFTLDDANAYAITTYEGETYVYKGYPEVKKSENEVTVVPANTGVVLYKANAEAKVSVPLFYPACNNESPTDDDLATLGNNWMYPNVESLLHSEETQKWNDTDCTKFIMTTKAYTYDKKTDSTVQKEESTVEAFYRMRIDIDSNHTEAERTKNNTIGANKSYLLIPSDKLPTALWNGGNGKGVPMNAKGVIFIDLENVEGEDAMTTGINAISEQIVDSDAQNVYYSLDGMRIEGKPNAKGVYICNGKKIYIK